MRVVVKSVLQIQLRRDRCVTLRPLGLHTNEHRRVACVFALLTKPCDLAMERDDALRRRPVIGRALVADAAKHAGHYLG